MWKMVQQKNPQDFIICTGKTYSIKQFINYCVDHLRLRTKWTGKGINTKLINLDTNKIIIKINPKFFRPSEVNYLKGSYKKANKILGWKPKTSLKDLVKLMINEEIKYYK
jgi:GDPmannose 4,6-dehydratase